MLQFTCQSASSANIRINIEGTLTTNETGITNEPVLFAYSVNNGESWVDLTSINTDIQGNFEVMWTPSVTGNYLVKANWAGNGVYPAVNTTVSFSLAPSQSDNFFSVNFNSTLSALTFDSEVKQLGFSVSGPNGTTG